MRFASPPLAPHYPDEDDDHQHSTMIVVSMDREEQFLRLRNNSTLSSQNFKSSSSLLPLQQKQQRSSSSSSYSVSLSILVAIIACVLFHFFIFNYYFAETLEEEILHPLHWNRLAVQHQEQMEANENAVADDDERDVDDDPLFSSSSVFSRSHARSLNNANRRRSHQYHRLPFSSLSLSNDNREKLARSSFVSLDDIRSTLSKSDPKLNGWQDLIFERHDDDDQAQITQSSPTSSTTTTACIGWRHTANCDADHGQRQPSLDQSCHAVIRLFPQNKKISGYCQCARTRMLLSGSSKEGNQDRDSRIEYFREGKVNCPQRITTNHDDDVKTTEFTCAQLCRDGELGRQFKHDTDARSLDLHEKLMFKEKFHRQRRFASGKDLVPSRKFNGDNDNDDDDDRQSITKNEDAALEKFFKEALRKRNADNLEARVHQTTPLRDENNNRREYETGDFDDVNNFASHRAHLFRKLRHHRREKRRNADDHYEQDLIEIERMVAGGFAGSHVDIAFERDVDERVKKAMEN